MKLCFALAFFFATTANSALAIDRDAFTITHYQLEAQVDRSSHVMAVTGKLKLRNDSKAPQKVVALQVTSSFAWNSIALDDAPGAASGPAVGAVGSKPVQWLSDDYTTDIDHTGSVSEAIVNLAQPVAPAAHFRCSVSVLEFPGAAHPAAHARR